MKLNVLIIEDESIVALHIKSMLIGMGHHVVEIVKDCADALKEAEKTKIDLVISDIKIEGDIDGTKCCKILQEKYKSLVIFISAYQDENTLKKASHVDFEDYLVKPFTEHQLEAMIKLVVLKYSSLSQSPKCIINDEYSYCHKQSKLFLNDNPIQLTNKEHKFLLSMLNAHGSTVTHKILEHTVWKDKQVGDGTRRQLLHRFNKKAPNFPIKILKGIGYKLDI